MTEKSPHETTRPTTKSPDLSGENATANITYLSGFYYTQNSFPPNNDVTVEGASVEGISISIFMSVVCISNK